MKKLMTIIGVAALLATVSNTFAQEGGWPLQTQIISLPAVIPIANSPTNFPSPILIDFGKTKIITPQFTVRSKDASSTTNVTFTGAWGDGLGNYDTNNAVTLTANMLAGKQCTTATNVITGNGRRYFYLLSESIGANSQVTNVAASYTATSSGY